MNIHKRTIVEDESSLMEIEYFGVNSKGTFTIVLQDGMIINFSNKEFYDLKKFVEGLK